MLETERILITVRTYPTPSTNYRETVCVGGINDKGKWRRLYPVPFRDLAKNQQFHIWDVIQVALQPSTSDKRIESRKPHLPTLEITGKAKSGADKCHWVEPTCFTSLRELKDADASLGPVIIDKVHDMEAIKDSEEWDPKRKAKIEQMMLFDKARPLEKIPFKFRFRWRDGDGEEHDSLVISWEMCETWRKFRIRYEDPIEKIREKLLGTYFAGVCAIFS